MAGAARARAAAAFRCARKERSKMITRRKLLAGIPAAGSVLLTACKDSLPPTFGSLFDASNTLTFASHRNGRPATNMDESRPAPPPHLLPLFAGGFVVAPIVALTSAGSGSILVPLLLVITAWRVQELAATSNWFGLIAGAAASLFHWRLHTFDASLVTAVCVGVVPGVVAGALLSRRLPRQYLSAAVYFLTIYLAAALLA